MMTFDNNEKKLKEELNKDVEIPVIVHEKINRAYRMIEDHTVVQKTPQKDPYRWMKTGAKIAGGMAAAMAVGFVFCAANPVMARELPLVGGLFEQLQENVSFFGNFADKATALEEPSQQAADSSDSQTAAPEENSAPSESVYTKTADGLTITFSEIYANDQAVYLSMQAVSEEPFPETMMDQEDQPVISMITDVSYSFLEEDQAELNPGTQYMNPEGKFLDDHTYACILRLNTKLEDTTEYQEKYDEMVEAVLDEMGVTHEDLNDETEEGYALLGEFNDKVSAQAGSLSSQYIKAITVPEVYELHLSISEFTGTKAEPEYWDSGYSQEELENMSDEEFREVMNQIPAEYSQHPNEHENYWFEGDWSFDIPVTVDNSLTETIEINETNDDGIGLASIVKTPYELTVNPLYKEGSDSDCFVVALDADGNMMPYNDSDGSVNNYAIQDRNVSSIDVYLVDYIQYMDDLKVRYYNEELENEEWKALLDENARYHKTVVLKQ